MAKSYKLKDLDKSLLDALKITNVIPHQWYIITVVSGYEDQVIKNLKDKITGYGMADKLSEIKVIKEKYRDVKIYSKFEAPKTMRNTKITKWETIIVDGETKYRCSKIKEGNKFNGYLFIKAEMTDQVWFLIRNTQMVTGLVGSSGKNVKPIPVSEEEILKLIEQNEKQKKIAAETWIKDFEKIGDEVQKKDEKVSSFEPNLNETEIDLSLSTTSSNESPDEKIITYEEPTNYHFVKGQTIKITGDSFYGEIAKIVELDDAKQQATIEFEFFGRLNRLTLAFSDIEETDEILM
ncbi:transcription termination/antitermination protein NusG [Ureaplasma canigenitalium]|uniref:transcription termination/antitermination protein NusG n=1 Tax=Ureaplasma canigenitalium TaxID=42092 RepID=UPI0004E0CD44|nr:transcription termination/antitermination protein NusG [Ureaplasma canigenitalium]